LKKAVDKELDRLESSGVLDKVDHNDWAVPIVVIPKNDGDVRLCGDYSETVNPALDVDQYPLPDISATLAGGKYFMKLDLSFISHAAPSHHGSVSSAHTNFVLLARANFKPPTFYIIRH
jgi:hypothetical protein